MEVSFTRRIILYSGKYGKYAISELICVLPGCLFFSIYANGLPYSPFYKHRAIVIDNTRKFFKAIIHPLEGLNSTIHSFAMLSALELYCHVVNNEAISARSFPKVSTCTQFWTLCPNLLIYIYVNIEIPSSSATFVRHTLGCSNHFVYNIQLSLHRQWLTFYADLQCSSHTNHTFFTWWTAHMPKLSLELQISLKSINKTTNVLVLNFLTTWWH